MFNAFSIFFCSVVEKALICLSVDSGNLTFEKHKQSICFSSCAVFNDDDNNLHTSLIVLFERALCWSELSASESIYFCKIV